MAKVFKSAAPSAIESSSSIEGIGALSDRVESALRRIASLVGLSIVALDQVNTGEPVSVLCLSGQQEAINAAIKAEVLTLDEINAEIHEAVARSSVASTSSPRLVTCNAGTPPPALNEHLVSVRQDLTETTVMLASIGSLCSLLEDPVGADASHAYPLLMALEACHEKASDACDRAELSMSSLWDAA